MTKIRSVLEQQFRAMPDQTFDLIVRTYDDATPHLEWLVSAGLQVKRQFRLSPGVAVSGSGTDALKLLSQDWVKTVELDAPISTM